LKDQPGDYILGGTGVYEKADDTCHADSVERLSLESSCKGTSVERFPLPCRGADEAFKKILFRTNLLPRIKKLLRECANPKDAVQARA